MAALIREPPRGDAPARRVSLRASADELDVSKIARAVRDGGGHRQAAGFSSNDSIEEITEFIRREFVAAHAMRAVRRRARSSRAGSCSSTSRPGPRRSRSSRDLRERTGARAGHAGTLDPFATGLLLVLSRVSTKRLSASSASTKRYETAVDLSQPTSTGDPEGEVVEEHDPPSEPELAACSTASAARST